MQAQRNGRDLLVCVAFVLFLCAPAIDFVARDGRVPSSFKENRRPAEFPRAPASAVDWSRWPAAFEAWHNDHFGLRAQFMRAHNALKIFVLRTSPSSRVVVGRDNWLFAATERSIEIWRGADPLSFDELEAWRRCLESRQRELKQRGIDYVFALAPSKAEIYPEYLPARFRKAGPSRTDQLVAHLATHSSFQIVDLRPPILEEKRKDQGGDFTYFSLGVHWNNRGAAAGLRGLLEELVGLRPELASVDGRIASQELVDDQADSWAGRLYLSDLLRQEVRSLHFADAQTRVLRVTEQPGQRQIVVDQDAAALPRALVFHDSFGETMVQMLGRHFSHSLWVWKPELDLALIEAEKPDVVLHLFNDRVLVTLTPQELDLNSRVRIATEYAAASQVALRVDCSRNAPPIESVSGAQVSIRGEGPTASVACQMQSDAATLRLPVFEVAEGKRAIVRLELESPIASTSNVFFQTRAEPSFSRSRQYQYEIHQGLNEIFVEVVDPDFNGKLLLKPSREAGTFLIRSLEARLVAR